VSELIVLLIAGAAAAYWFFLLRHGNLNFWRTAAKNPDAAFRHFSSDPCWKVFVEQLPSNYQTLLPKSEWVGPFQLTIPSLGNKTIYVFGRHPDYEQSQKEFLSKFVNNT